MGLRFAPAVADFVRSVAPQVKRDLRAALDLIREDPRHPSLDIKLLRKAGPDRFFRVRVRDYRIVYSPRGPDTFVWRIHHRSEGYGWLDRMDP